MEAEGLILAGGKSLRMGGRHKGSLIYQDETFTRILLKELKKEVSCIRLSYGEKVKENYSGCPVVMDIYPGCGPIGGLHAGLKACEGKFLLAAACDMPLLKIELFRHLADRLRGAGAAFYDGAVPVTGKGRIHPLAAIYKTSISDILEKQIKGGNYCLKDAFRHMNILYVDVTGNELYEQMLWNINTAKEYERLVKNE